MNYVFWILSVLGLLAIAYVQYEPDRETDETFLAMGMAPQVEVMREIASTNGWKITCEGRSGSMTVVRVSPGIFPWRKSWKAVRDEIVMVASSISSDNGVQASGGNCDIPEGTYRIHVDEQSDRFIASVGTEEYLSPMLEIARECDVRGAYIGPIEAQERMAMGDDVPTDWQALIVDPAREHRTGPIACLGIMANRYHSQAAAGE